MSDNKQYIDQIIRLKTAGREYMYSRIDYRAALKALEGEGK